MVNVDVHYGAKQTHGEFICGSKVETLLRLLEPMFSEWQLNTAQGVGWSLKAPGKYYPALLSYWLLHKPGRPHREAINPKARKFLIENRLNQLSGNNDRKDPVHTISTKDHS
ncbi:hypothetical protein ADM99_06190 [Leptolinea tardivitalis]|uniref:Uncharacterized protein n=2 Tax=Leptolinea tardivitalis TaxID=229920 RepID=A0A0P6X0J8_9CHLR|nr:hypothetical protein ADM99_06190 [Leptolinea tardivitalis]GAP20987.1 hypothetical protein LTAR_01192 [Leptolinea tardivitalis]